MDNFQYGAYLNIKVIIYHLIKNSGFLGESRVIMLL